MSLFGGSGDGGAAAQEAARQANINKGLTQIDQQFSGFNDPFYKQAATDYTNAVVPGMMRDYRNTRNNLTYALARGGLLDSGAAVQRDAALSNQLAASQAQVANNAQQQSNQLRANVNTQKGQLVSQLEASGDPSSIASQAAAATSQLRAPSAIQPLGNLFADWSQQYLAGMYANSAAQPGTPSIWNNLANSGVGTLGGGGGSSYYVN